MQKLAYPQLSVGLVGAWRPSAGATGFRLIDRSGRGNHGTLTNMDPPTDWVVSGGQMALDFDGVNDYVLSSLAYRPGAGPFSVSCWWTGKLTNGFGNIVGTRQSGFSGSSKMWAVCYGDFITGTTSQRVSFGLFDTISRYRSWLTNSNIDTGSLRHICCVSTGSDAAIYVDGVSVPITLSTAGAWPTVDDGGTVSIGAGNDGGIPVSGCVDDVMIFNRVLTPTEIRLLASRRGIAYQRRKRRYAFNATPSFLAAWARNSNVLIQPGVA